MAGLAGCVELPEVDRYTCGNRVVEPEIGEECDGVAGCGLAESPHGCGWVCDEQSCPTGYACGSDFRCRQPTETFVAIGAQQMATASVTATDMDGDGAADLLGYDSRGLVMRFGDWDGTLAAQTRVPVPPVGTSACTADVDGNGVRDLALPIGDFGFGLFVGDGARGLTPVAQSAITFDNILGPGCDPILATNIASQPGAEPRLLLAAGGTAVAFLEDVTACAGQVDCAISAAGGEMLDGRIAVATLGYGALAGVHPGAQFTLGVAGQSSVSVWGEALTAVRPRRVGTWILPEPLGTDGHVVFAQLDGDGCPDLVIDTGSMMRIAYSTTSAGACTGLSATLTAAAYPAGPMIGFGDTDGDGGDELIVSIYDDSVAGEEYHAIAAYAPSGVPGQWTFRGLVLSEERPLAAVTLDYDRDGHRDLVMTFENASTVDFFLGYEGAGYSRFPVDVGGHPRAPQVGDFDGDLHDDVVFAVPDEANPEGRDAVMLLYGDPGGRPVGPQDLGAFIADARPTPVDGGLQSFTDSVLVVSNHLGDDTVCDRRLAVLIGDTSRQLISPFVLTYTDPAVGVVPVAPVSIADVSGVDGVARTLAIGLAPDFVGGGDPFTVLSVLGFVEGEFAIEPGMQVGIRAADLPRSYFDGARWRTGDLDGDFVAEAVAVAGPLGVVIGLDGAITFTPFALADELAYPSWIDLVDVELDGDLDLVGAGGAAVPATELGEPIGAASYFWILENTGGNLDADAPIVLAMPDDLFCYDAATIHSTLDGAPQLAALCYVGATGTFGVAIGTYDPSRASDAVVDLRIVPVDGAPGQLEIADFTGDGLDDLALFTDAAVALYRQCRADEVCLLAEPF